jgi:hypothetical protein
VSAAASLWSSSNTWNSLSLQIFCVFATGVPSYVPLFTFVASLKHATRTSLGDALSKAAHSHTVKAEHAPFCGHTIWTKPPPFGVRASPATRTPPPPSPSLLLANARERGRSGCWPCALDGTDARTIRARYKCAQRLVQQLVWAIWKWGAGVNLELPSSVSLLKWQQSVGHRPAGGKEEPNLSHAISTHTHTHAHTWALSLSRSHTPGV